MFSRRHAVAALATAVAALAAPAGAQASAQTAACAGADIVPDAANVQVAAQATLCLLNDERAGAGLHPLVEAQGLTQPSTAYSARMVQQNFFAHVAPDGATLTDRLEADGYIDPDGDWTVGENLAWGQGNLATPRNIMVAWMNSPGHRANILTPEFTEVGLGVVPGTPGDATWGATYTTDFGAVTRDTPAPAGTVTAASAGTKAAKRAKTTKRKTTRGKAAHAVKSCKVSTAGARSASAKGAKKGSKSRRGSTCAVAARVVKRKRA
jgi:uncharacterized protein YkwD